MDVTIIPDVEIDLLLSTVDEAIDLARANRAEDGYRELQYGFDRAQALASTGCSEEWVPLLINLYQECVTNYCFRYQVNPKGLHSAGGEVP